MDRRNNEYLGQIYGKYKVLARSERKWNGRCGFVIQNIQTGETKEVSRAYVYIIKKRTTDPNYLANHKKTEQVKEESVSTPNQPEQKEENTSGQN